MKKNNYTQIRLVVVYAVRNLTKMKFSIKVTDHCHQNGNYRGATVHLWCNLRFEENSYIPVMAESFLGYENDLIIVRIA